MINATVTRMFRDRYTGIIHKRGERIEIDGNRAKELDGFINVEDAGEKVEAKKRAKRGKGDA